MKSLQIEMKGKDLVKTFCNQVNYHYYRYHMKTQKTEQRQPLKSDGVK